MKVRNGFVSNSSSSSFVLVIPDNFDSKKYLETKNINITEMRQDYEIDIENIEELIELLDSEIKNGYTAYQYDAGGIFYMISELLREFILTEDEVGSEDGGIKYFKSSELIKKIKKINNNYSKIK